MDVPPTPAPAEPGPEELALEYLQQRSEGVHLALDTYLARLAREEDRQEFRELVDALSRTERELPRAPRALVQALVVAGRYELVRQIGAGGMGQVWEARDQQLARRVAIKFLEAASQGRADREELFRKESRLLASLKHPGIVAVHEFGQDGDLTYIVMDLVEGRSLASVLEAARTELVRDAKEAMPRSAGLLERAIDLPVPDGRTTLLDASEWFGCVARIELELVRILEAAHGQRVIHRDLKPSNVMLLGGGHPVVLDFGLAGSLDLVQGAVTQGLYGSMAYLAPEQARSQTVGTDPRTDIYQLGLILYELLTLRRTFPGTAIGDVLERIGHGRFALPREVHPGVPRELEAICLKALELAPERRYADAGALRADLERFVSGREPPLAAHANRLRILSRRARWHARQHPWWAASAGLVVAGVLSSAAWWSLAPGPETSSVSAAPVRYDRQQKRSVDLLGEELVVGSEDYLGYRIRCANGLHVWTLSIYGEDPQRLRVSPWRAATTEKLERLLADQGEWGLELPAGENVVLGAEIGFGSAPSAYEGLLLFTSLEPRPEIERWFEDLASREKSDSSAGIAWTQACELGVQSVLQGRGGGPQTYGARPLGEEQKQEVGAAFRKAALEREGKRLDLPGVEEFEVQCRSRVPASPPR